MARYIFDTSALVKHYHAEPGTPVDALFAKPGAELFVSRLAVVEVTSALSLKVRRMRYSWDRRPACQAS
jgi:hypothetical protein